MAADKWLGPNAAHARRVRALRDALEFPTASAFATFLGISAPRLSNVENGAPLGKDIAFRMAQRIPGLTLDWLWFGKTDGLSFQLARKLEAAAAAEGKAMTRS